jgi:hypothetical protein
MNRKFNKKQFELVMKGTAIVTKILNVILYIALAVIAALFIAVIFINQRHFNFDLSMLDNINVSINNILYELSGDTLSGIVNVKTILLVGAGVAFINLGFVQYIILTVRKLVTNIKDDQPFDQQNTILLKNLAIGFLIASVVLSILNSVFFTVVMNQLEIAEMNVNYTINTTYLFMGILIFILAYVFDYGSYLQEEYDHTI